MSKFYEDWAKNVSSRLFTCFHYIHIKKTAPPPGGHVFPLITTIFKLVRDIHKTNRIQYQVAIFNIAKVMVNVKVFGRTHKLTDRRTDQQFNCNMPPSCGSKMAKSDIADYQGLWFIKEIIATVHHVSMDISPQETNVLTEFYEDWAKKKMTPPGGHVVLPIQTIFELNSHIQKTHVLTKFHKDWTQKCECSNRKLPCPPCGHVFSPIWTILKLIRDINETNVLTKFHDDWAIIVTSRVFTRKTAPPPGGHINILTKLREDWASNVTSTVFT
ncbi:hypothetical protein DPMN_034636, partial [Dreissena polymorpha]